MVSGTGVQESRSLECSIRSLTSGVECVSSYSTKLADVKHVVCWMCSSCSLMFCSALSC